MLIKAKKLVSLVLTFVMLLTVFPSVSFAAAPTSSEDQITNQGGMRYYDVAGREVTESPILGSNAVVSVAKTIKGTDVENEFMIDLEAKTSVDISNVKMSSDAAVVLVLDISDSMGSNLASLKSAACDFLDNYVEEAGGAVRNASLVTFGSNAAIAVGWTDVADSGNLSSMKTKIQKLGLGGGTFMQGGLILARNLLRTDALPSGTGDETIGNRSVILFSDGVANMYTNSTTVDYSTGTRLKGTNNSVDIARDRAEAMADVVKDRTSFTTTQTETLDKYDSSLYTIAFGSSAPAAWLGDTIAINSSFAYSAADLSELNDAFKAIVERISSWLEAWIVTDPMGMNIEFISDITQADFDAGLLKYENDTLSWDLKKAAPSSEDDGIYTYNYSYRIRLDTMSDTFKSGTSYPTNGETELILIMVENGRITSDVMTVTFSVPEGKGYVGSFDFTKVGDNTNSLAGCVFTLTNQNKESHYFTDVSEDITGKVSFANIPSGHTYLLKEISMPDVYKGTYLQNSETYTVTVSYGNVLIEDSQGKDVTGNFKFNNPLRESPEKKVVSEAGRDGVVVAAGDNLTYEIGYVNYEENPATIVITDKLPAGVDFVSADRDGVYDPDTHMVTWILTEQASGESGKVNLVAEVNEKAVVKLENSAEVQVGDNPSQVTNTAENPVTPEEPKYSARYIFKSDGGSTLPREVLELLPVDSSTYADNDTVTALTLGQTTVTVAEGTWTFDGWDANGKTISGADVTFAGIWTFTENVEPEGYHASYTFTSAAPGKALPQEVWVQLPGDDSIYADGSTVIALNPGQTTVTVTDGTWTFDGWDANSKTISGADVTFAGIWTFTENVEPEGYHAGYTFESSTPEKALPQEVWAQLPTDSGTYADGDTVTALAPGQTTVAVADGTWTFDGWDADSKMILSADVILVGTWTFTANEVPDEYNADYIFESKDGVAMPPEVLALLPVDSNTYADGDTVTAINPNQTMVKTADGTWAFTGWDKDSATVERADVTFTGIWTFEPKEEPTDPTDPTAPSDSKKRAGDTKNITNSGTNTNNATPTTRGDSSPKTGDTGNIGLWITLLCVSLASMVYLLWAVRGRKRYSSKHGHF